jgi:AraC-like DNA-binding protein
VTERKTEKSVGILNYPAFEQTLHFARYLPSSDLAGFIEHYWIVAWDRRGQEPFIQEVLPHPSVHLTLIRNQSALFGVMTGKFAYHCVGKGHVFGVKFRPGAFYPFYRQPVSNFIDATLPIDAVFGVDVNELEASVVGQADETERVRIVESVLRAHLPERDPNVELIGRIIDAIAADRSIRRADDLIERMNLPRRTIQRLFNEYVGIGLKWVIQRQRLHEAVEQIADGQPVDWAGLALDLGYFDQAHLIKDFKSIMGQTPGEYVRAIALGIEA